MASVLRFRKLCYVEPVSFGYAKVEQKLDKKKDKPLPPTTRTAIEINKNRKRQHQQQQWRRIDSCCWIIGYMCTTWWLLLLLYYCLPATFPGFQIPESPGTKLKSEGLTALHPVVLVPGIVTGGLELWEGKTCADSLFRKRLWGGSFTEIFRRYMLI